MQPGGVLLAPQMGSVNSQVIYLHSSAMLYMFPIAASLLSSLLTLSRILRSFLLRLTSHTCSPRIDYFPSSVKGCEGPFVTPSKNQCLSSGGPRNLWQTNLAELGCYVAIWNVKPLAQCLAYNRHSMNNDCCYLYYYYCCHHYNP